MSWSIRLQGRFYSRLLPFRSLSTKGTTHYETLGISRDASSKDIKDSYIELSKVHHPDSVKGSAENFRTISEAYEILSNEESKKEYDNSLPGPVNTSGRGHFSRGTLRRDRPPLHRSIEVDLSQKRMEKAWHLYKDRWSREEERWRELERLKKEFRKDLDGIRANMHNMTPEERALFLEGLRQFRRPEHYEQFRQSSSKAKNSANAPNSSSKAKNSANAPNSSSKSNQSTVPPHRESTYSALKKEIIEKAEELRHKAEKIRKIYDKSEFLGENYVENRPSSVKYDIDHKGEEFRISQRTIQVIFGIFFLVFIIDSIYKNDVRKTNRFFLMEAERNAKKDSS